MVTRRALPPAPGDEEVIEGTVVERPNQSVATVLRAAVTHRHSRMAARNTAYIGIGVIVTARQLWDSRTTARYDRMLSAAEAAGNHEAALQWEERRAKFIKERHDRRMAWVELPFRVVKLAPAAAAVAFCTLAATGIAMAAATGNVRDIAAPFEFVAWLVTSVVFVAVATWAWVLTTATVAFVAWLWRTGRKHAGMIVPSWAVTGAEADDDLPIDETTIARALAALRIPQIRDFLAKGGVFQYIVQPRQEGRGTYCELRLPPGVPAELIARRRQQLGTGLFRLAKEVWPSKGADEGILRLWVADKGALNEGAGPYPLLHDGFTDVFKGLPFGRTLRGDPQRIPVEGRNTICGGMPDQGKSSAARIIAMGYALDPTAELRIYIPDTNHDFQAFRPRCSRYVMGAEDEKIAEILEELRDLHAEIQTRGELLVRYKEPEVTRELASAGVGLHPLFVLLEEAHVAILHGQGRRKPRGDDEGEPAYGEEIGRLLGQITKLGRKRGIHLMVSTQAPVRGSMPPDVTMNCANGIAFAVGDHFANDALLGAGAYSGGHRATELIPGQDVGTALCKGFSGQRSELVQAYFLSVRSGSDQVTPIIDRVMAELERLGRPVPGTDGASLPPATRDMLADLEAVMGDGDKVRLSDLPARLRKHAPHWLPYRGLDGTTSLAELLDKAGVRWTNGGNVPKLDPADLRDAIARRESEVS
jgi:DNA segregation ATPase FtsK/SpoIIIE, S-DNA-T family